MSRLEWKVSKYLFYKDRWKIPLGEEVPFNPIRLYSPLSKKIMRFVKPLSSLHEYFFSSGFIRRKIGKWIKKYIDKYSTFLDIGCGDLALRRQLPKHVIYNAFDISFSEYILDFAMRLKSVNIAIASATKIPLDSNQVSILTAIEVLEHIPSIDKALEEIYRVAKPNALFFVSIPNNFCYKYDIKGQHEDHCNKWTYNTFINEMKSYGFHVIKGHQQGWWIPFPRYIVKKVSYQLPISSVYEYYNTNFFFIFKIIK